MSKILKTEVEPFESQKIKLLKGEVFKPCTCIEGYEGVYYVSNMGRVYSLPRILTMQYDNGNTFNHRVIGGMLKPAKDSRGRPMVGIGNTSKRPNFYMVHRLVGMTFLEKPKDFKRKKYIICRKDASVDNCRADNLMWEEASLNRKHTDCYKVAIVVHDNVGNEPDITFESMVECANHFNSSKQCIFHAVKAKCRFRRRYTITRVREGYTMQDKIREQGGLKYKC